jgi:UDP-glucuronate 4-epimerase
VKVLVTGAAGFIGSHVVDRLLERGHTVVGLDNFDPFYPRWRKQDNLAHAGSHCRFSLLEGDVRSPQSLDVALTELPGRADVAVHLAALAGVQPSLADPARYYDVNLMGTVQLLEACRRGRVGAAILASSSSVYGADSAIPFAESDPCAKPMSPYAASKRAAELAAWNAHQLHGLPVTCLRFFTVYGPRQRPDLAIHKFVGRISRGEVIELYGDGGTSRDYTYVDDVVDGVLAAIDQLARGGPARFRIYNLSGAASTTLRQLVDLLAETLGTTPRILSRPEQPGDMRATCADLTLSREELGYAPKVPLRDGLARFVAWWQRARHDDRKSRCHG